MRTLRRLLATLLMLVALSACQLLVPFAGPESDSSPSESVEATTSPTQATPQPVMPTAAPTAQPDPVAPTPEIPPPYY